MRWLCSKDAECHGVAVSVRVFYLFVGSFIIFIFLGCLFVGFFVSFCVRSHVALPVLRYYQVCVWETYSCRRCPTGGCSSCLKFSNQGQSYYDCP